MEDDEHPLVRALAQVVAHLRGEIELHSTTLSAEEIDGYTAGMNLQYDNPHAPGTAEARDWWAGNAIAHSRYGSM